MKMVFLERGSCQGGRETRRGLRFVSMLFLFPEGEVLLVAVRERYGGIERHLTENTRHTNCFSRSARSAEPGEKIKIKNIEGSGLVG